MSEQNGRFSEFKIQINAPVDLVDLFRKKGSVFLDLPDDDEALGVRIKKLVDEEDEVIYKIADSWAWIEISKGDYIHKITGLDIFGDNPAWIQYYEGLKIVAQYGQYVIVSTSWNSGLDGVTVLYDLEQSCLVGSLTSPFLEIDYIRENELFVDCSQLNEYGWEDSEIKFLCHYGNANVYMASETDEDPFLGGFNTKVYPYIDVKSVEDIANHERVAIEDVGEFKHGYYTSEAVFIRHNGEVYRFELERMFAEDEILMMGTMCHADVLKIKMARGRRK